MRIRRVMDGFGVRAIVALSRLLADREEGIATAAARMDARPNSSYQPRECSMLVLTRKLQEKIQIGDNITITILRTKGKSVRLGIEAPLEVPVIRGELSFEEAAVASD